MKSLIPIALTVVLTILLASCGKPLLVLDGFAVKTGAQSALKLKRGGL